MTKRSRRTARKLVLPLIAVGMMTMMMYLDSVRRAGRVAAHQPVVVTGSR